MTGNDLMGITRDDLAYDLGRHVDESVHLFEEWGTRSGRPTATACATTAPKRRRKACRR
ncbi:MAG: hypothetical protein U1F67_15925 [Rubrivivax sp.]